MPESATELIERAERECGGRFDDEHRGADVMNVLFGALARAQGQSRHRPEDDFVAGVVIRHQNSAAGARERASNEALGRMLSAGVDPAALFGSE